MPVAPLCVFLQAFEAPVGPFCVFPQPIQALISALGKKPSAFREFLDQHFEFREVASHSSDVGSQLVDSDTQLIEPDAELIDPNAKLANQRVILGLAFEQELNSAIEFISGHQRPFSI